MPHGAGKQAAEHSDGAGFETRQWYYWPDHEDLSIELTQLLTSAQDGGATVAECLRTASRIDPGNEESWVREWSLAGDVSLDRGNGAMSRGHGSTALNNWLRAITYYQAATLPLDPADARLQALMSRMRSSASRYLDHLTPKGEVVEIGWIEHHSLQGYFLPPPACAGPAPLVICIGEPGSCKEQYLHKTARHARARGMALLAVDLIGPGLGAAALERVVGRTDLEQAIVAVIDYAVSRGDVDESRIAVLGDAWGSSFVARGIARDPRLAAAVCDGGLWDLHERGFLLRRATALDIRVASMRRRHGIARQIKCPVLVTLGEQGWLDKEHVTALFDELKASHRDIQLKVFSRAETGSAQGHADNPTLANEYIFDWIADRLDGNEDQRDARRVHAANGAHGERSALGGHV